MEKLIDDTLSYTHTLGFPKSNFLNRPPSESLNNPFFCRRFLIRQTGGRKAETEYRSHNYIEHLKIINSATVSHEASEDGQTGAKGTHYIDCLLNSAIIFNKFLTNRYYLAMYNRAIFVPEFINQLKQFTYEQLHHSTNQKQLQKRKWAQTKSRSFSRLNYLR